MPENPPRTSQTAREERLALALRENLKRRKAQARGHAPVAPLSKTEETS